jgi:uncharacterized membrane protein YhaH (DUF805 family)
VNRSAFEWAIRPMKLYADFSGRAPRAEYWWFAVAMTVIGLLAEYLDGMFGAPLVGAYGPASLLTTFGLLVPGVAVLVRRLHDIDRSGWWALLSAGSYVFVAVGFTTEPEGLVQAFEGLGTPALITMALAWMAAIIVLLIFTITRGNEGMNRFGPDPYGGAQLEEIFA